MADKELIALLRQGPDAWNAWREAYPNIIPDLHGADLRVANLQGANLTEVDLRLADLTKADLRKAVLRWANLHRADFTGANLSHACVTEVSPGEVYLVRANPRTDLSGANLSWANLAGADLRGANLSHATLYRTKLHEANLSSVYLRAASLRQADLERVKFRGANLLEADLSHADLAGSNFTNAKIGWTTFAANNLAQVAGLDTVRHEGPSSLGIDTIHTSEGRIPEVFLRGAGVPDSFITYNGSLLGKPFEYYSCFISYSSADGDFANRLHADLQDNGVRCWFAPEDLKTGERFHDRIEESIRLHDKVVLILSESSVASSWVRREVEAAREREDRERRDVLFPIRVDDSAMKSNAAWASDIRRSRHVGDFTQWKEHAAYRRSFQRLLRD